ncbi:MAG TPA: hypothetical protein PL029_11300, partial [Bacteroidia bacterium]|nr:hypothetical protein [Bacteroidia bacterium]
MITGREKEIAILNAKLASKRSEFVALYGRRRVGKTYLIRNVFKGRFTFRLTGLAQASLQDQLANFHLAMHDQHHQKKRPKTKSW